VLTNKNASVTACPKTYTRNMKKQGNITPPRVYNSPIAESKDIVMVEMPDKEFKSLVLKMISNLNKDSDKHNDEGEK
jgi:hypothetical protein